MFLRTVFQRVGQATADLMDSFDSELGDLCECAPSFTCLDCALLGPAGAVTEPWPTATSGREGTRTPDLLRVEQAL